MDDIWAGYFHPDFTIPSKKGNSETISAMLTINSRNFVLKHVLNRVGGGQIPALSCVYNRFSSTSNDNKSTIKSVSAAATEGKKASVKAELNNNKQSNSKKVVSNDKLKKKMGKYVEGEKINYKEVHKVIF